MVFFLILRLETWLDMGILLFLHLFKFNSASSYLLPELKKKKKDLGNTSLNTVQKRFWVTVSSFVVSVNLTTEFSALPFPYHLGSNYKWFNYSKKLFKLT